MKKSCLLYTFVASVFLMLISGSLMTTGMFVDGITYGNVADNMATGLCTFWHPSHSPSLYPDFYQHPPLVMGLLALFYKVFGVHVWVTRLFTMLATVVTALLVVKLWQRMGYDKRTGWLPLLLWVMIPAMSRNAHDNMLECTMAIFVLAAVLCLLHRDGRLRLLRDALGGVFLFLAFLCKGFTGLYPLVLPLIVWVVDWIVGKQAHRGRALLLALADMLAAAGAFAVCFGITGLIFPDWMDYFDQYMNNQVRPGLSDATVVSRWTIVRNFFEQTIIIWALAIVAVGVMWKKERQHVARTDLRVFWICFLLALSGVLPIAISLKQHGFYILTVYPIMAVAIGAVVQTAVVRWTNDLGNRHPWVITVVACVALAGAVILNAMHCGQPGRDATLQQDMHEIAACLEEGEQIGIPASLWDEWNLYAYYYREKHIDLKTVDFSQGGIELPLHLLTDGHEAVPNEMYDEMALATRQYKLYKLKQ